MKVRPYIVLQNDISKSGLKAIFSSASPGWTVRFLGMMIRVFRKRKSRSIPWYQFRHTILFFLSSRLKSMRISTAVIEANSSSYQEHTALQTVVIVPRNRQSQIATHMVCWQTFSFCVDFYGPAIYKDEEKPYQGHGGVLIIFSSFSNPRVAC